MELERRARTPRGEIAWGSFGEGPPVVLVHGTPSRAFVWRTTHDDLPPETFAELFGQWQGAHGQALYVRNMAQLDEEHTGTFEDRLRTMATPTLVLWGEEDAWLPLEVSERIEALLPDARRVVLPEAGHFSMEDRPHDVARHLGDFFG